jgi:hypothetical protein
MEWLFLLLAGLWAGLSDLLSRPVQSAGLRILRPNTGLLMGGSSTGTGQSSQSQTKKRYDNDNDNDNDVYCQGRGAPQPSQLGLNRRSSSRLGPTVLIL